MGETCNSHDGMCEQITETRISVGRLEEQIKILPEIADSVKSMKGFIAGVSFCMSLVFSVITLAIVYLKH